MKQHQLCPRLCYIQTDEASCQGLIDQSCMGACEKEEAPAAYNSRVEQAIHSLKHLLPSFVVIDEGEEPGEQSCVLIERGNFYGMGKIPAGLSLNDINALKSHLQPYPENDYAKGLVYSYVEQHPEKRVDLPMGQ